MLTIRQLVKVYPGNPPVTALYGVDLDIPPGMFGLLGPNGAGKTTLMRVLAGVLEATSGEARLDDVDILRNPERLYPLLGFLPQEFGFYPHLTGAQMLDFLLTMKGVEAEGRTRANLVSELLERVNLAHAAKRRVKEYSGGMRQRLGIAQAVAGNPQLIIVDEPTAGLDPEERHRFYRLLTELAEDRTVLLSTHIVEDVAVLCRRFAMIKQGRVVAQTTPSDARAALRGTIFEGDIETRDLAAFRERFTVTQAVLTEGTNRVRVYQPNQTPPAPGFASVAPTLEDAYLAVMRGNATLTLKDEGGRKEEREKLRAAVAYAPPPVSPPVSPPLSPPLSPPAPGGYAAVIAAPAVPAATAPAPPSVAAAPTPYHFDLDDETTQAANGANSVDARKRQMQDEETELNGGAR